MKKLTVTMMCGLPGSGKSTWIKKNKMSDEVIISLDDIRSTIFGHQFHKDSEPWIIAFAKSMAKLLLSQNKSIIIDATNLHRFMRTGWRDIAHEYNATILIVVFKVPLDKCIARNNKRDKKVPVEEIHRMYAMKQDIDTLEEEKLYDHIIYVNK